jgi:hypothetical protein
MAARARAAVDDRLWSVEEWGQVLGVSRAQAYRLVAAGHVEPTDVGASGRPRLRISRTAHEAYLKRRAIAPPSRTRRGAR